MSRSPRLHLTGGFYHVTMRGNHRQAIFFRPADRRILESIVASAMARYEARVHAYCWMTNHIHLLIQVADQPLGRIMLRIASRYARIVQKRFKTTGHLFERRYHAVLVDHDAYLLTVLRYIHQNPLRAGMVTSLTDYRWSSHCVYAGLRRRRWVTSEFALQMLHSDRSKAVAAYLRWMDEPASIDQIASHRDDARVVGRDEFMRKVQAAGWMPSARSSLEDMLQKVCIEFSVTCDQLRSASKDRRLASARAAFAMRAVDARVASISEVARTLQRHEASIRGLMRRHASR